MSDSRPEIRLDTIFVASDDNKLDQQGSAPMESLFQQELTLPPVGSVMEVPYQHGSTPQPTRNQVEILYQQGVTPQPIVSPSEISSQFGSTPIPVMNPTRLPVDNPVDKPPTKNKRCKPIFLNSVRLECVIVPLIFIAAAFSVAVSVSIATVKYNGLLSDRAMSQVGSSGVQVAQSVGMNMEKIENLVDSTAYSLNLGMIPCGGSHADKITTTKSLFPSVYAFDVAALGIAVVNGTVTVALNGSIGLPGPYFYNTTNHTTCLTHIVDIRTFETNWILFCQDTDPDGILSPMGVPPIATITEPAWTQLVIQHAIYEQKKVYSYVMLRYSNFTCVDNGTTSIGFIYAGWRVNFLNTILDESGVPDGGTAYIVDDNKCSLVIAGNTPDGKVTNTSLPERLYRNWFKNCHSNTSVAPGPADGTSDTWTTYGGKWSPMGSKHTVVSATRVTRGVLSWIVIVEVDPVLQTVNWEVIAAALGITVSLCCVSAIVLLRVSSNISSISKDMENVSLLKYRSTGNGLIEKPIEETLALAYSQYQTVSDSSQLQQESGTGIHRSPSEFNIVCTNDMAYSLKHDEEKYSYSFISSIRSLQESFIKLRNAVSILAKYAPLSVIMTLINSKTPLKRKEEEVTSLWLKCDSGMTISDTIIPGNTARFKDLWSTTFALAVSRKGGTTIDKDQDILCLFGAPRAIETPSENAVEVAYSFDMLLQMFKQKTDFKKANYHVGIHRGSVTMGHVGHAEWLKYDANGSVIDVSKTLANACVIYGLNILVSEDIKKLTEDTFRYVFIDFLFLDKECKYCIRAYHPYEKTNSNDEQLARETDILRMIHNQVENNNIMLAIELVKNALHSSYTKTIQQLLKNLQSGRLHPDLYKQI